MGYWEKHQSSRPNISNSIQYAGGQSSVPSTAFGPQTFQIRVSTQVAGFLKIDGSGVTATQNDMFLPVGFVDYLQVIPGSFAGFISTSTSTGAVSI